MNQYTIYCTKEQTERAIKLGASCFSPDDYEPIRLPTAEQMCGWLREKGYFITPIVSYMIKTKYGFILNNITNKVKFKRQSIEWDSYEQAIHAAINVALDYLDTIH